MGGGLRVTGYGLQVVWISGSSVCGFLVLDCMFRVPCSGLLVVVLLQFEGMFSCLLRVPVAQVIVCSLSHCRLVLG